MPPTATVSSVIVFVAELERSLRFYGELFSCTVRSREGQRALLETPGGFRIHLREIGSRAMRAQRAIGPEALVWKVASREELDSCEKALRGLGGPVNVQEAGGIRYVQARDPDRVPVIVRFPDPPSDTLELLDPRLYE